MIRLLAAALLVLSSCSNSPEKARQNEPAAPKDTAYAVFTVEIKGMKFVPDSIVARKGDRVIFVNRDLVPHCVTELDSKAWTSHIIPPGEDYMHVVDSSSNYYCAIHKVMKGKIRVKE
ncbi:MAG: cupredoxin domain-containing protein [Bacteroidota bacterium]|nr:cupredoxin domain-containing protein [Bacteroidota bacterium]MDP4217375.1 cupredoxin domain-containing protein [Bacteroidota bacterium]MDP4247954.1 cupredoxin domain-containing protein [Bacteroidota bacterium]MDP4252851.1 cupredoxin domain-containing protein [Bacteroidota bacterium]MDP4259843.1 cupredoxin domain-containing protein [Bacteroidota bacterium]